MTCETGSEAIRRASGILLHPTSLPGRHGIGDLGHAAYRFVDFCRLAARPYGRSSPATSQATETPLTSACPAWGGNPLLLSLQVIVEEGWIAETVLHNAPEFPEDLVDFGRLIPFKWRILKAAAQGVFLLQPKSLRRREFEGFSFQAQRMVGGTPLNSWRSKMPTNGAAWPEWKQRSDPDPDEVLAHKFIQFEFFRQWGALKRYANERGVRIIGDLPIFVAHDSADVWANKILFDLHQDGSPRTIAGVPPDYFSATGQRWGNPLYRWDVMAATGYRWWIERMRATLEMVDIVRLDHFRGFEKYYEIPGTAVTAETGRWVEGPGIQPLCRARTSAGKTSSHRGRSWIYHAGSRGAAR